RYWSDFIPSWAGAISIDLLPVVLVLVLMVVHDAMRREAQSMAEAETMTAAEMLRAVDIYRQLQTKEQAIAAEAAEPFASSPQEEGEPSSPADQPKTAPDATVTPIEAGQRKRGEGPTRS